MFRWNNLVKAVIPILGFLCVVKVEAARVILNSPVRNIDARAALDGTRDSNQRAMYRYGFWEADVSAGVSSIWGSASAYAHQAGWTELGQFISGSTTVRGSGSGIPTSHKTFDIKSVKKDYFTIRGSGGDITIFLLVSYSIRSNNPQNVLRRSIVQLREVSPLGWRPFERSLSNIGSDWLPELHEVSLRDGSYCLLVESNTQSFGASSEMEVYTHATIFWPSNVEVVLTPEPLPMPTPIIETRDLGLPELELAP